METPISDKALKDDWPKFSSALYQRLLQGKTDYGDTSFCKEPLQLICEIQEELMDVCGWAFINHCVLERLKLQVADLSGVCRHKIDILGQNQP
jgi:hypothetical protein